jgi:small basic protein
VGPEPPSKTVFHLYLLAVTAIAVAIVLASYLLFRIAVPDVVTALVRSPAETVTSNPFSVALFVGVHVLIVLLVATIVAFGARVDQSTARDQRE